MKRSAFAVPVLSLGLLFLALGTAQATSVTYSLDTDHCTGNCGLAEFGSVKLDDFGSSGDVQVTVNLVNGNRFVKTGFPGSFGFDLIGNPTIAVGPITPGWSLLSTSAGTQHFDGFGDLEYALVCDICGPGGSSPKAPPLVFDVLASGLTIGNFAEQSTSGATPTFFVADIISANLATGPVGTTATVTPLAAVLEPATLVLLGTGLAAAYRARRRKS